MYVTVGGEESTPAPAEPKDEAESLRQKARQDADQRIASARAEAEQRSAAIRAEARRFVESLAAREAASRRRLAEAEALIQSAAGSIEQASREEDLLSQFDEVLERLRTAGPPMSSDANADVSSPSDLN